MVSEQSMWIPWSCDRLHSVRFKFTCDSLENVLNHTWMTEFSHKRVSVVELTPT